VFIQPQEKTTDSSSRGDSDQTSRSTKSKKNDVVLTQTSDTKKLAETVVDTLKGPESPVAQLFVVPYQSKLNQDSLQAASRKVVLEIDTIPKGLSLIYNPGVVDTLTPQTITYTKSIFSSHLLVTKNIEPRAVVKDGQNWIALLIVAIMLLLGVLRVFYQKKFTLFLSASVSKRFSNQLIREENALTQGTSVMLTIIFFLAVSLFFYLSLDDLNIKMGVVNDIQQFIIILTACIGFYFLKIFLHKLSGYIFKVYKETDEYIFNQFIVIQVSGLLLVLWCVLMSYCSDINKQYVVFIGFSTLLLSFIVRMIKSLGISNMGSYSPVYIFLYLCSLEILPLIIIIKLVLF
jgi:hypothetical protein